ncbi:hypothetical protein BHE74_00003243 [Ensete ventricosum]|nr:hypothetical protein BHE74_00003243 [Ensete ventricosum]
MVEIEWYRLIAADPCTGQLPYRYVSSGTGLTARGKARIARRRRLRKKREEEEEEEKKKEEEEKKKEEEEKYLAHALSPPAGRLRAVTALVVALAARGQLFSQSSPNSNSPNSNPAYPGFPCLLDLLVVVSFYLCFFSG